MTSYAAIRDAAGRLVGWHERGTESDEPTFARTIAETQASVGAPEQPTLATTDDRRPTTDERPASWRPGRAELAAVVIGVLVTIILIAALNTFWPAAPGTHPRPALTPTQAPAPTPAPTALPTPVLQDAYDAPGGSLLGTIPLTATLAYQHSGYPGWGGVKWDGGVTWVQTDRDLAGLIDLAPPPTRAPDLRPASVPASTPAVVEPSRVCDPTLNPAFVVEQDVVGPHGEPWGHARGVSCTSQEEAQVNANAQADMVRANVATADAQPAPTPNNR